MQKSIYFAITCLVLVGLLFGFNIQVSSSFIELLNSILGLVTAIATITAALVGYKALNQWREQFIHQKRYDAFSELWDVARDWIGYVEEILDSKLEAINKRQELPLAIDEILSSKEYSQIKKKFRVKSKIAAAIEPKFHSSSCDYYKIDSEFRTYILQSEKIIGRLRVNTAPEHIDEHNELVSEFMVLLNKYYRFADKLEDQLAGFQNGKI